MGANQFFDKTSANLITPGHVTVNRTTGKFVSPAQSTTAIKIHVSKPQSDLALPGGVHAEAEDVLVHVAASYGVKATDILAFWGVQWRVVVEVDRYDVLKAATNHDRRKFLVRRLANATNS